LIAAFAGAFLAWILDDQILNALRTKRRSATGHHNRFGYQFLTDGADELGGDRKLSRRGRFQFFLKNKKIKEKRVERFTFSSSANPAAFWSESRINGSGALALELSRAFKCIFWIMYLPEGWSIAIGSSGVVSTNSSIGIPVVLLIFI
jgi:hypothetical protein